MARSLFLKEKEIALASLLVLFICSSYAQAPSQTITYSCRTTRLETVLSVLSRQSGYDFVYSSSIIDLSKPISLTVKNKSISEVLALIEPQANVSFRLRDRHIVIKGNPKPEPIIVPQNIERQVAVTKTAFNLNDAILLSSTSKALPVKMFESQASQLEKHLNKRIIELQQLLRANILHNISNYYLNGININNRYNGWYTSIGTYVGDHSSGLEFQGGLKYLYGVFNPRWSPDHGLYGAYGIGSSLQLRGHFSLNTMYIFSGYSDSQLIHHYRMGIPDGPDTRYTVVKRQHQVKLGLRYSFNENLSLRAGPVFNYRSTVNHFALVPSNNAPYGGVEYRPGYGAPTAISNTQSYTNTFRSTERWIGWDISLQYRINFYKKGF